MVRYPIAAAIALLVSASSAAPAQQSPAPIPLYPGAPPPAIPPLPLPPVVTSPVTPNEVPASPMFSPRLERIFCEQPVNVQLGDLDAVPPRFRAFIGMFSDASWTPLLCAALVVENVAADGTATIVYAFGPMGSNDHLPGGVLRGTGIITDGELRFQNADGSQFAFRPLYGDLDGHLTTPQGRTYEAIFKRTP
jgi:hypothetical protein